MKPLRRNFVLLAILFGCVTAIGLYKYFAGQQTRSVNNDTIRVGIIPITDCAQVFIAKQAGLFSRQRLQIEIIPMGSGAAILQALAAGSIDVGFANLASAVFFERSAGPLLGLSGGTRMDPSHSEAGLVVLKNAKITSLKDLRTKTIAVNALRNIVDLAVLRALRLDGIKFDDVKLVELPFKDMEAALRTKTIDAAALPEPFLSRALLDGNLLNLGDHFIWAFGELYSTGFFTQPSKFERQRDLFLRFNQAIEEATPIANAYGDVAQAAISAETKVSIEDLKRAGRPEFVTKVPRTAIADMSRWLKEEGFIDK